MAIQYRRTQICAATEQLLRHHVSGATQWIKQAAAQMRIMPRRGVTVPYVSLVNGAPNSVRAARCCAIGVRISRSSKGLSLAKLSERQDAAVDEGRRLGPAGG